MRPATPGAVRQVGRDVPVPDERCAVLVTAVSTLDGPAFPAILPVDLVAPRELVHMFRALDVAASMSYGYTHSLHGNRVYQRTRAGLPGGVRGWAEAVRVARILHQQWVCDELGRRVRNAPMYRLWTRSR